MVQAPLPRVTLSGVGLLNEAAVAKYAVSLSGTWTDPVSVSFAVTAGTASVPGDIDPPSGTVTVPAGQTSATFTVTPVDDDIHEGNETYTVSISNPTDATPGTTTSVNDTLVDNDPVPKASIAGPTTVAEGAASATYTVSLTNPTVDLVTVPWSLTAGTASVTGDVGPASGSVTIAALQKTATFVVTPVHDLVHEGDEAFTVALGTPTNATLDTTTSLAVTIVDDDPVPTVTLAGPASVGEGAPKATYQAVLSNPTVDPVSVSWSVTAGTAAVPGDVGPASGTVTIPALQSGASFDVIPVDDAVFEGDETFTVSLSTPVNAALGAPASIGVTLVDNEARPTVSISGPSSVSEASGTATYTASLSGAATLPVTVPVSLVLGTAGGLDVYTR